MNVTNLHDRLDQIIAEATALPPRSVRAMLLLAEIVEVWQKIYNLDQTPENEQNVQFSELMFVKSFPAVSQA